MNLSSPMSPQAAHIAIVLHDFSTGGSERIAIRLANRWAAAGRRVTILSGVADGPARALVGPGVTVVALWPEVPRSLLSRITLGMAVADCLALLAPDVLFAPGNFHIPVIGAIARRLGEERPPIVCKLSNPLRRGRPAAVQMLYEVVKRRLTRSIDGIVAMSAPLADEARSVLGDRLIRLIHEPNIEEAPPPAEPVETRRGTTIVCAGRLVPQKNFELAIRAFARLDPALDARLLILGEGERRAALERLIARMGLGDRVRLAGHVADIRPTLATARLFLMSSRYEGYPAVLIEALVAGVPVVTTACSSSLGEILIDRSFGRIAADDPGSLAQAMTAMLANPSPIDARPLIERHGADHSAAGYLALFDELVQTRTISGWLA